jgi:hypothetical protein
VGKKCHLKGLKIIQLIDNKIIRDLLSGIKKSPLSVAQGLL